MARPRLAVTLETLGAEGVQGFYNGTIAANILRDIQNANGIITSEDLLSYRFLQFFILLLRILAFLLIFWA